MRLKTALLALELIYTVGLLAFVMIGYLTASPLGKELFLTFVFYPLSILAAVIMFSYYVSVKFGKSIFAYGIVLGLAISLSIFAVRAMPPVLTLGVALYLINRLTVIVDAKEIKQISAAFLADHLISFQIGSLLVVTVAARNEYWSILEKATTSSLLLVIIVVWYLFTIFYESKELYRAFRRWSRSE